MIKPGPACTICPGYQYAIISSDVRARGDHATLAEMERQGINVEDVSPRVDIHQQEDGSLYVEQWRWLN